MKMPTVSRYLLSALLASAVLVACSSSQNSQNGTTYTRTANGSNVQVNEDEYHIHMPAAFPGGMVTFHITNQGNMEHGFKIKGNGIEQQLQSHLAPGASTDMTVQLTPGSYEVICPIIGHADLGMRLTVAVLP